MPGPCTFCQAIETKLYLLTREGAADQRTPLDSDKRTRAILPICGAHLAALREVGSKGRVHGATGVRWWLGST